MTQTLVGTTRNQVCFRVESVLAGDPSLSQEANMKSMGHFFFLIPTEFSKQIENHRLFPQQGTIVRWFGQNALLQGIFPTQRSNPGLAPWRLILYWLSHQGSPRILEWVAYPFFRGSSQPRNWTRVSCIAGGFFTSWTTREARLGKTSLFWKRKWQPTLVFLPGRSHGQKSLAGYSPCGCTESDVTEWLHFHWVKMDFSDSRKHIIFFQIQNHGHHPWQKETVEPWHSVDYGKGSVPWCDHKGKGERWRKTTNKRADEFLPWCSLEPVWEAVSGTPSLAGKHVGTESHQTRRGSAEITFSSPRFCMETFADFRKSTVFSSALELEVKGANSLELNSLLLSLLPQ